MDEIEYNTDIHTLMFSADFTYSDKLSFNGSIVWNNGEAEMEDVDAGTFTGLDPNGSYAGMNHYVSLPGWEDNSDLEIDQVEYSLGAVYNLTDSISLNLNASYFDYSDDEPYLYDTDGDVLYVNGGMTMRF